MGTVKGCCSLPQNVVSFVCFYFGGVKLVLLFLSFVFSLVSELIGDVSDYPQSILENKILPLSSLILPLTIQEKFFKGIISL